MQPYQPLSTVHIPSDNKILNSGNGIILFTVWEIIFQFHHHISQTAFKIVLFQEFNFLWSLGIFLFDQFPVGKTMDLISDRTL